MLKHSAYFPDKSFIKVSGLDKDKFLQGLITNDIRELENSKIIFACFLTANGRFLYDFFIWKYEDSYLIEISKKWAGDFFAKLKFYKIRLDVSLELTDEYQSMVVFPSVQVEQKQSFLQAEDPRKEGFATRIILRKDDDLAELEVKFGRENYDSYRIQNLIAEGDKDLEQEKSIILEFAYDKQNAISFTKGCYLGQELITRTHRLGVIRKSLQSIKVDKDVNLELPYVLSREEKKVAIISSFAALEDGKLFLVLVKDDYNITAEDLQEGQIGN